MLRHAARSASQWARSPSSYACSSSSNAASSASSNSRYRRKKPSSITSLPFAMRALRSVGSGESMVLRVRLTVSRSASVDHALRERLDRLGHVEAAFVDRPTDDDPREPAAPGAQLGERAQV